MAGSEEQEECDEGVLKVPEGDLGLLSQEEIDALLEAGEETGNSADVIQELVTEALVAKMRLRSGLVLDEVMSPHDHESWKHWYDEKGSGNDNDLDLIIDDLEDFTQRDVEMLTKIGVVTLRDLCLLSQDDLRRAGIDDEEIYRIELFLFKRFVFFLMG